MRRCSTAVYTLAMLLAGVGCSERTEPIAEHQRYVLVLVVDTLRFDYLSRNGHPLPTTPFLDSLHEEAAVFTRAITPVGRTTPAIASLFTGLYPHGHRVTTLHHRLSEVIGYVPEMARSRGYRTIAVVSNPILGTSRQLDRGFDVYDVSDTGRPASATTAAALAEVRTLSPETPVFLWAHYLDPHVPYRPPAELAAQFDPGYAGPYELHFGGDDSGAIDQHAYPPELGKEGAVFRNTLAPEVNRHITNLYAADIRHTDDEIRHLLAGLEEHTGREWLVVLTADHGESLGENNYYYDHGAYVSDGELRIPLLFRLPSSAPSSRSLVVDEWVSLVDVAPTLIDLLDLTPDPSKPLIGHGRSLAGAIAGGPLNPSPVYAESGKAFFPQWIDKRYDFTSAGRLRAIYLADRKLTWTPGAPDDLEYQVELFDPPSGQPVRRQPGERELRRMLTEWTQTPSEDGLGPDAEDLEKLRSLGYID